MSTTPQPAYDDGFGVLQPPSRGASAMPAAYGNKPITFDLPVVRTKKEEAPIVVVNFNVPEGAPVGISTDLDASRRLILKMAGNFRYVPTLGWAEWDGTRWKFDPENQNVLHPKLVSMSTACAREWTRLTHANFPGDGNRIKKAEGMEGGSHINAAVTLAASDPRVNLRAAMLDANPWDLNLMNGTLDLRTGTLRPHRREDFNSKLADVLFRPEARHETLDRFLVGLDRNAEGLSAFLGRFFGMCMTGDVSAETFFVISGEGGSGKTTLTEAFAGLMGDYCFKPPFETFCAGKNEKEGGAPSPDILRFRDMRFVYSTEGKSSSRLNEGKVKQLTGNETVTGRALYSNGFETLKPTWKICLVSNFDPRTDSEDPGIWRRTIKVHFKAIPEAERDCQVKETLLNDMEARSAILNWCLAGCLDWQKQGRGRPGLAIPEAVTKLVEDYRAQQDTLLEWWEEIQNRFEVDEEMVGKGYAERSEFFASTASLWLDYVSWTEVERVRQPKAKEAVMKYLEGKRLYRGRFRGVNGVRLYGFKGIKPRPTDLSKETT